MSALVPNFAPGGLPPLPPIISPELRSLVFTHRSFAARPTHVFEDSPTDPSPDNEILEHLGDQVLGLVVTELLQEMYPYLRVGPSTKIRALVVGNSTLATVAMRYNLTESLRLHRAQSITLKASMNVQADVFESYIGGLYKDQGLFAVQVWLRALFRPYIDEAYRIVRYQHGLGPTDHNYSQIGMQPAPTPPPSPPSHALSMSIGGHLGLFNQRLQQENRTVEWTFVDSAGEGTKATPVWVARAFIDGVEWGHGRGSTKKAAKNEAAKLGLQRLGVDVVCVLSRPSLF
ncbi:ribonuclease III domain-containing protein [Amylostereum chailletii]|nr:ribonuclease III domain-containing protein [Amylostereum chailletii]